MLNNTDCCISHNKLRGIRAIEKVTPIGSKVVYEKWTEKATGKEYVGVNLVYQSTDQLQHNAPLDLDHAPQVFPLSFKGLQKNADGLYSFEQINERFETLLVEREVDMVER